MLEAAVLICLVGSIVVLTYTILYWNGEKELKRHEQEINEKP